MVYKSFTNVSFVQFSGLRSIKKWDTVRILYYQIIFRISIIHMFELNCYIIDCMIVAVKDVVNRD